MSRKTDPSEVASGIGSGYGYFQLAKALTAQDSDSDPGVRARAAERVRRWQQVIAHAVDGTADYGSRTPFTNLPAWATPEVITGGFATGHLLAGGELTSFERNLAVSIPGIRPGTERRDLNVWYLTDDGVKDLQQRLARGDFHIGVPEESALPIVAWLLGQQRVEEARVLIETIAPFFDRLRFFPPPAQGGVPESATVVHIIGAGEVRRLLNELPAQSQLALQKHVVDRRLPLYDAAVEMFLETYAEDWPCRHYPEGWHEQAAELSALFRTVEQDDPRRAGASHDRVAELYVLLAACVNNPQALMGRQVGRIRQIVGDFVRKHGRPSSDAHRAHRAEQRRQLAAPAHHRIAQAVSARLAAYPSDAGIADFAALSEPLTAGEAHALGMPAATAIPVAIRRRLERCRCGTIAELVGCGLITSGDTLARVLPTLTAEIRSAGFADASLRRLYAETYRAFRRRRSLLLLNLQSQVALTELPWVAVFQGDRLPDAIAADAARQALVESAATTLSAFPHAIVPNKLLQEFIALANTAQIDLPFVREVAADIFMGEFSETFISAARRAAPVLADTLYARYYAIDTDVLAELPGRPQESARSRTWREKPRGDALAMLCAQRANAVLGVWNPANNGTVIEQQQILTTQNLALLLHDLGVKLLLRDRLSTIAHDCFVWLCARQQMRIERHHARLVMLKNTAYAWRQMIFYLSLLDTSAQSSALAGIQAHFARQTESFRARFLPAMLGLRLAAAGQTLPQYEPASDGARVFLGWTTARHWLMS